MAVLDLAPFVSAAEKLLASLRVYEAVAAPLSYRFDLETTWPLLANCGGEAIATERELQNLGYPPGGGTFFLTGVEFPTPTARAHIAVIRRFLAEQRGGEPGYGVQANGTWGIRIIQGRRPRDPRAAPLARFDACLLRLEVAINALREAAGPRAAGGWTEYKTIREWARDFGRHRNTMAKMLRNQKPRNQHDNRQNYRLAVDDLPPNLRPRYTRPA